MSPIRSSQMGNVPDYLREGLEYRQPDEVRFHQQFEQAEARRNRDDATHSGAAKDLAHPTEAGLFGRLRPPSEPIKLPTNCFGWTASTPAPVAGGKTTGRRIPSQNIPRQASNMESMHAGKGRW